MAKQECIALIKLVGGGALCSILILDSYVKFYVIR